MKLLARTNSYYIFFSVVTYIIIAGGFYLVVEYVIYKDVEERLTVERRDFEEFIRSHPAWNDDFSFVEGKIFLSKITTPPKTFPAFKDTSLFNRYNSQLVPFREHSFVCTIGADVYKVSIRKSLIESNKLLKFITGTMLLLLSVGLALLFLFQRRISKTLWKPFYETLSRTKSFDVTVGKNLQLPKNDVYEFNELNIELNKMTDKISRDYKNLQEFTENASHEIQTPLALINSRVEDIIQDKDFSERLMAHIQDIHDSTLRLSKLNQALLLLSKIENGQFYAHAQINVSEVIARKIPEFEEVSTFKGLQVTYERIADFYVDINPSLAEIMITNLINNAVKHNVTDGFITITSNDDMLVFKNSGVAISVDPEVLFERFKKQNQSSNSLGLGLAIIRKICSTHNLTTKYTYGNNTHTMEIARMQ